MSARPIRPVHVAAVALVGLAIGAAAALALGVGGSADTTGVDDAAPTSPPVTDTTLEPVERSSPTTSVPLPSAEQQLAAVVAGMSLDEKARQLVITGMASPSAAGEFCPAGVFINDRTGDRRGFRHDVADIRTAGASCVAGPLIFTDAEPGDRVVKAPIPEDVRLAESPDLYRAYLESPESALAALGTDADAFAAALRDLDVDVNFGVLADVDVDDGYYVARERRSFGGDPAAVDGLADILVDRHCAAGVAATLKHFPNQGATPEDPHEVISTSAHDERDWADSGRVPYVDTPAPLVMTGHIMMRDVDPTLPASLSFAHTTGLLREDLGYEGVIVTDDLTGMAGVTSIVGEAADRAVEAIASGADLALFVDAGPHDATVAAIRDRAESDPVFAARVDESVTRVLRLKSALGQLPSVAEGAFALCGPFTPPHVEGEPVVVVANGTTEPGLAGRTADELRAAGYVTIGTNATPTGDTTILHAAGAADVAATIADELGASAEIVIETSRRDAASRLTSPAFGGADVWVLMGTDHETALPG